MINLSYDGLTHVETKVAEKLEHEFGFSVSCAVVVADPGLHDCPMVACSDGFETLTGFSESDARGRNLRFLNEGLPMEPQMREALRSSNDTGIEFMGIIPNRRKNGERFQMLLHMASVSVQGYWHIMGIQADVTDVPMDLMEPCCAESLRVALGPILSADLDALLPSQVPICEAAVHIENSVGTYDCLECTSEADEAPSLAWNTYSAKSLAQNRGTSCAEEQTHISSSNDSYKRSVAELRRIFVSTLPKSVGSIFHPKLCIECKFYATARGCAKGSDCRFCHAYHGLSASENDEEHASSTTKSASSSDVGSQRCE